MQGISRGSSGAARTAAARPASAGACRARRRASSVPGRGERGRHVGEGDRLADASGPTVPLVTRPIATPASSTIGARLRAPARARGRAGRRACVAAPCGELALDRRRARVAAGTRAARPANLLDRPGQAGLDRRRRRVDVVAVEAQAGLEAQRVARAEAGGLDLGLGEQGARQRFGVAARRPRSRSRPRRCSPSASRSSRCRRFAPRRRS